LYFAFYCDFDPVLLGPNYKKHVMIILGYDSDVQCVERQTYEKFTMY